MIDDAESQKHVTTCQLLRYRVPLRSTLGAKGVSRGLFLVDRHSMAATMGVMGYFVGDIWSSVRMAPVLGQAPVQQARGAYSL